MDKRICMLAKPLYRNVIFALLVPMCCAQICFGWGKDGHKMINRVAAQTLPSDIPAFLRTPQAISEIEYLGPEPDRWRSPAEPELSAAQAPEHFLDLELAQLAAPDGLPRRRFDFIRDLYAAQILHPELAAKLSPQTVGLLPWQADEVFERLKADMRGYRDRLADHRDTYPVEQAILYDAGWLGHYVADGSQPLHTTIDYNGWVEAENPEGFTRDHRIHSQFESEFVHDNIKAQDIQPLVPMTPRVLDAPFENFLAYLQATHRQVRETYRLEKKGGFHGHGSAQSRSFTIERLAAGATMLRDMIYTAWVQSAQPVPDWHDHAPKPAAENNKPS
ncbi:MAG: phospholipase C/P1 nuclease family protein [Acidobacteriaceae bacterium]